MRRARLFAPAFAVPEAQRGACLAAARGWCAEARLELLADPTPWSRPPADDLVFAAQHADVLIAARGGFGCIALADVALALPRLPCVVGYSDVCVLHALRFVRGARDGVHGLMPAVATTTARTRSTTAALVRGESLAISASDVPTATTLHAGCAGGVLFPACLRILAGLCGTALQPDLRGALLALEDIDEAPWRLDRDLWQLHRAGVLYGITGLIFAQFTGHGDAAALDRVLRTWANRLAVPTLAGLPFGHDADAFALPVGGQAQLVADGPTWQLTACPGRP